MKRQEKNNNFFDVIIKIKVDKITTDFYCKPTDGHQYLHCYSYHAEHLKGSIFFSQTLRLRRICSEKNDLNSNVENVNEWFEKRSYSEQLIKKQVACALQ